MGTWQTIKDATGISDVEKAGAGLAQGMRDLTGASTITKALNGANNRANDGHTTSGIDSSMQDLANKLHPAGGSK